jgi:hypothetical protein
MLINTDGIALIGPGSEWFWAALRTIGDQSTYESGVAGMAKSSGSLTPVA